MNFQMSFILKIQKASFIPAIFSPSINTTPTPFFPTKNRTLILDTSSVFVFASALCVCFVYSMSFTPNIVNIHRTILHVLALHLGRAGSKFWFTSLEHHERGGGGRKGEGFWGGEVVVERRKRKGRGGGWGGVGRGGRNSYSRL